VVAAVATALGSHALAGRPGKSFPRAADPQNGRSPRRATLRPRFRPASRRERSRSRQAMIAWKQKSWAAGGQSRPQAGGAGRAQREP
jgi:hypothetical protein